MIHKLGLNKDNEIKNFYFKKIDVDLDIDKANDNINIISAFINSKVSSIDIDTSLDKNNSLISVQFFLNYKILYNLKDKNSVFVLKEESFHMVEFFRKNYIEGCSIEELMLNKAINIEVKINNIDLELKEKKIKVTSYLVFSINCEKQYSLAFVSSTETMENNIFLASNDMSKILQKTFTRDVTYKDVAFIKNSQDICYLSNEDGNFSLYILGIKSLVSKKVFTDINIDEIISFTLVGGHNIIFLAKTTEGLSLCKGNLRNGTFVNLTNIVNEANNIKFLIDKAKDTIYYFKIYKEKSTLYELKNKSFNIELAGIEGQVLCCDINDYIIGIVNLAQKLNIFIYKDSVTYIPLPAYVEDIVKVNIARFSKLMYMLCISKNEALMLIYDIENRSFKTIPSKLNLYKACDFVLSPCEEELFYTIKGDKNLNIYNLNLKTFQNTFLISMPYTNLSLYYKN